MRLAIILAEYGKPAPDVTQYRETWPEADIQVFSGLDLPEVPALDPAHPRYGWRMNDYWKVRKMLDSGADVAMCFDGDMRIVDREDAHMLPKLAERYGACLPINPRYLVHVDGHVGADSEWGIGEMDAPSAMTSVNCSPIAIGLKHPQGRALAENYCAEILRQPQRGPIVWARAMAYCAFCGMILAPQWCVCERHIGVGNEIILHEGHESVKLHYAGMGHDGRWRHGG